MIKDVFEKRREKVRRRLIKKKKKTRGDSLGSAAAYLIEFVCKV